MPRVETVSIELPAGDNDKPFVQSPMWVVDGLFQVQTFGLSTRARDGAAYSQMAKDSTWGIRYLALHDLIVKNTTPGSNGTLVYLGTIVRTQEDLDAILRAGN